MEKNLDKMFLVTYTAKGDDGFSHFYHAWFETEGELRAFTQGENAQKRSVEVDLAIEILEYRSIDL